MKMSPLIVPANYTNAPSYEDLVNALVQVRHATSPHPDDYGHHEAAHDIADAVLKRVEVWRQYNAQTPEPLACHVCGSTSEQHFNGCGIAEFCPETGRPIPRETDPPAPEKSVGSIPPGWKLVPEVFIDGDAWCALFGADIQSGIAAFGDTPEEATNNFYAELRKVRIWMAANGRCDAAIDRAIFEAVRTGDMLAAAPAPPLPCHVCGTTSELHAQFCSVAPPPPITKDEKTLLLHTLCGLDHDHPSYRNRYAAYPLSDPAEVIESLVSKRMMVQVPVEADNGLMMYCATAAGAAAVGKTLPKD